MLVGPHAQDLGRGQRLQEHQVALRPRSLGLVGPLPALGRHDRQRESRQVDPAVGGRERVRLRFVYAGSRLSFCVRTLSGHADWVRSVVPSSDGRMLVSCSNDQSARLWDVASSETRIDLRGHEHVIEIAIFAPTAAHAAIRELAGIVRAAQMPTVLIRSGRPASEGQGDRAALRRPRDRLARQDDPHLGRHERPMSADARASPPSELH